MQLGDEGCDKTEDTDPRDTSEPRDWEEYGGFSRLNLQVCGSPLTSQGQKKPLQCHTCSWLRLKQKVPERINRKIELTVPEINYKNVRNFRSVFSFMFSVF